MRQSKYLNNGVEQDHRAVKRIVRELQRDEPDVAACDALVKQCFESADYREGRAAFMEKRKPVFRGV